MYITHQQEAFSRAFVSAVATAAGFKVASGGEPDDDSVDLVIGATGPVGRMRSPKIEVQLKCTRGDPPDADFTFDLPVKNYEDLGGPLAEYQAPRILVVVYVPEDVNQWAVQDTGMLVLRHHAYWLCLHDSLPTTNTKSVRVQIPAKNSFTPMALKTMMDRVGKGGRPS
jgi:hypothetical protein